MTSSVLLADVIDDGNLPSMIMQIDKAVEAVRRDVDVQRFTGPVDPVTMGDVFLDLQ
jgi:hypothetical protein